MEQHLEAEWNKSVCESPKKKLGKNNPKMRRMDGQIKDIELENKSRYVKLLYKKSKAYKNNINGMKNEQQQREQQHKQIQKEHFKRKKM